MSRSVWLLMSVLLLIASACSSGSDASPEVGSSVEPGEPPGSEPPPDEEDPDQGTPVPDDDPGAALPGGPTGIEALEELGGRLAITDRTSLLLIDPTGANGEFIDEVADGLIAQPTWSPDGAEIAWARFDADASPSPGSIERMTLPDDVAGLEGGERNSTPTGETTAVYLQWSDDASRIGFLVNGDDGIELQRVRGDERPELMTTGAPLYFAWGPDNEALAWHVGTDLQVRRGGSLDTLAVTEGTFTAPDWLTDDEVMAVRGSKLVLVDPDNGFVNEVAEVQSPTQFVLHSDSGRVAFLGPGSDVLTIRYQNPDDEPGDSQPGEPPDPAPDEPESESPESESPESESPESESPREPVLQMLDVRSENLALVTAEPVLAWEWSPDGQRLAFLAASDFDDEKLRWFFWQDGRVVGATSEFWLTPTERSVYLPFFAQYTQSHTRWSPDGAGFAFAGIVDDQEGIWVHVINETPQSILVADGDFVTWSPETVSNGSGISPL